MVMSAASHGQAVRNVEGEGDDGGANDNGDHIPQPQARTLVHEWGGITATQIRQQRRQRNIQEPTLSFRTTKGEKEAIFFFLVRFHKREALCV